MSAKRVLSQKHKGKKGLARCSGSNWVFFPDPNWLCAPGANIGKAGTVLASGAYS